MNRHRAILLCAIAAAVLSACNLKEAARETGDAVQQGVQNIGEAAKETPEAIGEATNKLESDIRD